MHEFGDVLAWLASLANQMDIDLDDAMQRYVENPPLSDIESRCQGFRIGTTAAAAQRTCGGHVH